MKTQSFINLNCFSFKVSIFLIRLNHEVLFGFVRCGYAFGCGTKADVVKVHQ